MSERRASVSAADEHAPGAALPTTGRVSRERDDRQNGSPHSNKFLAVSATLIGVAVAAIIVAAFILLGQSRATAGPQWSTWKPPDSGLAGEREIAAAVSPFYRAAPASQLVVVTVNNINSASASSGSGSGTQIALRDPTTGSLSALSGRTAQFNLCGLGTGCSIATGSPSAARMLLLRREALELALYTFKYIGGVDNVVALLPPGKAAPTTTGSLTQTPPSTPKAPAKTVTVNLALLFQRQTLSHYLGQPLRATLPEPIPPTVTEMPEAPEAELVSVLTSQTLFQHHTVQAQDGSNVVVLDQVPPQ